MPEHRLPLDPRNPGQFFACCGLFELAELAVPGGEAWFEDNGGIFALRTMAPMPPQSFQLEPQPNLGGQPYDATLEPLVLSVSGRPFTLNWWLNEALTDKSSLKTHGGPQKPRQVLGVLLGLLDPAAPVERLWQVETYTKSRFGVDARSAWEAIDAGYSPNDEGQNAKTFPWVEVLAVTGLQGFRPARAGRFAFQYAVWLTPMTRTSARAACASPWPGLPARSFRFAIGVRGQGYKTFLFSEGVDHA